MRATLEERLQRRLETLTIVRAVRMVAVLAFTLALVAALVEWAVDPGIDTLGDALWWAISTVTTVGYGDVVPESTAGKIVAGVLMLAGVSAIPITTSLVVAVFVARSRAQERESDIDDREQLMARLGRIERMLEDRDAG